MSSVYSEQEYAEASFSEEPNAVIEIIGQKDYTYGNLFHGYVDHENNERGYFSGVLDGKIISFTHWDSVTRGTLIQKGNKPLEIHFINNAFFADERGSRRMTHPHGVNLQQHITTKRQGLSRLCLFLSPFAARTLVPALAKFIPEAGFP